MNLAILFAKSYEQAEPSLLEREEAEGRRREEEERRRSKEEQERRRELPAQETAATAAERPMQPKEAERHSDPTTAPEELHKKTEKPEDPEQGRVLLFVCHDGGEAPVDLPLDATVADLKQEAMKVLCMRGRVEYHGQPLDAGAALADTSIGMQARVNFVRFTEADEEELGRRLYEAAGEGELQKVEAAVAEGADPNWVNKEETWTPLFWAANRGHAETVEVLHRLGADVNAKDDSGDTPLHRAAMDHAETVEVLCRLGADINAKDMFGETPLDRAWKGEEILRGLGAKKGREL